MSSAGDGELELEADSPDKVDEKEEAAKEDKIKQLDVQNSIYCLTFVSMITEVRVKYELDEFVEDYFFKSFMIFFIQMLIVMFILNGALTNTDGLEYIKPELNFLALRLLCCYLFHMGNYGDVADSYQRLKFLRNNP